MAGEAPPAFIKAEAEARETLAELERSSDALGGFRSKYERLHEALLRSR